jgi:hypothetical protein
MFLQLFRGQFLQSLENFQAYIRPLIMTDIQHIFPSSILASQMCNGARRKYSCLNIHEQASALSHNVAVFAFVPDALKLYVQKNNWGGRKSEVG